MGYTTDVVKEVIIFPFIEKIVAVNWLFSKRMANSALEEYFLSIFSVQ